MMILLRKHLILFLSFFVLSSLACSSDEDCELNGVCQGNLCKCNPEWTGTNCSTLNLKPALKSGGQNLLKERTSVWGGTTIKDDNGLYHFFFSRIGYNCGLSAWESDSEIWHATGNSPYGPWSTGTRLLRAFGHGPHIVRGPKSEGSPYLLYHLGDGTQDHPTMYCKNGSTPPECLTDPSKCYNPATSRGKVGAGTHWMGILYSNSLSAPAPWAEVQVIGPGLSGTNPSAYIFENGTVLLAYRYDDDKKAERIGLARADNWRGPYKIVHQPLFNEAEALDEDPFIWRDVKGNFHMLTHHFGEGVGRHAFSRDGLNWRYGGTAYTTSVVWNDGTSERLRRRERPELVFDDSGIPILLYNGVVPGDLGDFSFGMVQPINS